MASLIQNKKASILLDRVYEHVTLPPLIRAAIDTPIFQRLRQLKQLGASSFLYPGAVHTRFEHSIGVAHLAGTWVNALQEKQPSLNITEDERMEVMLAALLHDIGHGPFSHLFENVVVPRLDSEKTYDHEEMSVKLSSIVCQQDLGLGEETAKNVAGIILGKPTSKKRAFLSQIVHNERGVLDVDKLDYYMRDSLCCFGKHMAEVRPRRLFFGSGVVEANDEGDDKTRTATTVATTICELAFENKLAVTIRELCMLRAKLHRAVYQHPVVLRIGWMIGDVIGFAADEDPKVRDFLLTSIATPEEFARLGDWIFDSIGSGSLFDTKEKAVKARKVYERIQRRQLYSMIGICHLHGSESFNKQREDFLKDALAKKVSQETGVNEQEIRDSLILDRVTVNHGNKADDPLASIRFYNPKTTSHDAASILVSNKLPLAPDVLTPAVFQERELVVICRETSDHVVAKELKKHFRSISQNIGFHLCGLPSVNV